MGAQLKAPQVQETMEWNKGHNSILQLTKLHYATCQIASCSLNLDILHIPKCYATFSLICVIETISILQFINMHLEIFPVMSHILLSSIMHDSIYQM